MPLGPSIIWRCLGPLQNNSPVMVAESSRGLFRKEGKEQRPTLVIRILLDSDQNRCMIYALNIQFSNFISVLLFNKVSTFKCKHSYFTEVINTNFFRTLYSRTPKHRVRVTLFGLMLQVGTASQHGYRGWQEVARRALSRTSDRKWGTSPPPRCRAEVRNWSLDESWFPFMLLSVLPWRQGAAKLSWRMLSLITYAKISK